ncbi:hypothetical protein A3F66_03355 [candidate division TM6 bacterium RIFCSPHIGHO2_12_FULL_32_22]|nr:MAG: hypothetical protein A3F66_03355 [candidate division TM6 bacterium RIFCSPHIGHO2_12_FULL_32_22]
MKILPIIHLCLFLGAIYIAASDRTENFYRSLNIRYTPAQEIIDLLRNLKIQLPGSHRTLDINPEGDQDIFAFDFFYNLLNDNREIKIARTNQGPNEHYYMADSLERYLRTALQQLLDDPYRFRQRFIPKDPDTGLPITDITEFVLHVPAPIENAAPSTIFQYRDAIRKNDIEKIKYLLEEGILNPNTRIHTDGDTPLIEAARKNNTQIMKVLLDSGARPNLQNRSGDTALIWAARNKNYDALEMLMQAGADPSITNQRGTKAADETRDPIVRDILTSSGAGPAC